MLGGSPAALASSGSVRPAVSAKQTPLNATPVSKHSQGLDQFFSAISGQEGLNILDFAGASQANVSFITNLGHRLSSEDYLRSLEITFGDEHFYENQDGPEQAAKFLHDNLNFPPGHFDGALVWDALQFLSPPLLEATV